MYFNPGTSTVFNTHMFIYCRHYIHWYIYTCTVLCVCMYICRTIMSTTYGVALNMNAIECKLNINCYNYMSGTDLLAHVKLLVRSQCLVLAWRDLSSDVGQIKSGKHGVTSSKSDRFTTVASSFVDCISWAVLTMVLTPVLSFVSFATICTSAILVSFDSRATSVCAAVTSSVTWGTDETVTSSTHVTLRRDFSERDLQYVQLMTLVD